MTQRLSTAQPTQRSNATMLAHHLGMELDLELGPVLWRDLAALGIDQRHLRSGMRSGSVVRVVRGGYAPAGALPARSVDRALAVHRLAATAMLSRLQGRVAASHHTGALLHGLPLWGVDLGTVHLTRLTDLPARVREGLVLHQPCPGQPLTTVDGHPVLGVADCVVGVGMSAAPRRSLSMSALVAADHALHEGLVTPAQLTAAVGRLKGYRAIGPVRAALDHADGRHESPAETRTAGVMRMMGLAFTPQVVHAVEGAEYRCDFTLDDHWVIVEVDGMGKYGDPSIMTPADISRALKQEKAREDALRGTGYIVVRVTWDDLSRPQQVMDRIRRAIALADRSGRRAR